MKRSLAEILAERKQSNINKQEQAMIELPFEDIAITKPESPIKRSMAEILASRRQIEAIKADTMLRASNEAIRDILQPELPKDATIDPYVTHGMLVNQAVAVALEKAEEETNQTFSMSVELNEQQILAKDMALTGKSFAFIGAAGTGKTTALREVARALLQSDKLRTHDFRIQGTPLKVTCPSLAIIAWTRIASGNAKRAIHKDPILAKALPHNVTTAHNLLEFTPEFFYDDVLGKESMRFIPRRDRYNKLTITHLVIEEASLIDIPMWEKLYDALEYGVQIIFVGDINQLPPVFGPSILNFALTQLPTIELTTVYRQQGDSLVLENAHRILEGKSVIEGEGFKIVRCGDKQYGQEKLSISLGQTFPKWMEAGVYDPDTDIILSPWNVKDLGTDSINKWIAQKLGTDRNATVHQILAGRTTLYLATEDKIMYNKQVAYVKKITLNASYMGKQPMVASNSLSRFGTYIGVHSDSDEFELDGYSGLDIDRILDEDIDVTKQCSHIVDIETEDGIEYTLETIGDFSPSAFSLGYSLTVHKAQGCEWRRVFLVMHKDHSINLSRELLYTAVTRAREECVIIAKEDLINKTIARQRLKGNTLKEKIAFFNNGLLNAQNVICIK